jgi:hypothetical protein
MLQSNKHFEVFIRYIYEALGVEIIETEIFPKIVSIQRVEWQIRLKTIHINYYNDFKKWSVYCQFSLSTPLTENGYNVTKSIQFINGKHFSALNKWILRITPGLSTHIKDYYGIERYSSNQTINAQESDMIKRWFHYECPTKSSMFLDAN